MLKVFRVIALSLVFAAALFSCKKDGSSPSGSYHLSAKFDGELKSFNTQVSAVKVQMLDGYTLAITGLNGTKETFSLSLWSDMEGFHNGDVFHSVAEVNSTYNSLGWAADIINSNETTIWSSTSSFVISPEDITVTITEITNEYVKGTFTGKVYQNVENPASKTISSGEFKAKF